MKNRVYFFTGTGNSLNVAQNIAASLDDCEVVAIHKGMNPTVPSGFERIGFVFPVYFWGLPRMVADFLRTAKFPVQGDTYYFAVATFGGIIGNSLPQVKRLLSTNDVKLNYGGGVRSFANAVSFYEMKEDVEKITRKADTRAQKVIAAIAARRPRKIGNGLKQIEKIYQRNISRFPERAKAYTVNADCISCGICVSVCPAQNIELVDGRPVFGDHCEACLACIQHCPKRALNDGEKTQARRRYTHPAIGYKMIANYYHKEE
ncbi:MAG: EFR1 family ferrodoxin [Clostridiales Family XIII bacterium]|nr:EFR1 family ferrodoxin [Clostridiales Family XIII bacterium]